MTHLIFEEQKTAHETGAEIVFIFHLPHITSGKPLGMRQDFIFT